MPRDLDTAAAAIKNGQAEQAIGFLIKHCHEFIHYHQFVGTQFGLVYRRLVAARARIREYLLQDIGADAYRSLMDEGAGRGALLTLAGADQLSLHQIVKAHADPSIIEILGWLDLFEDYLLKGEFSDLFASSGRVRAILEACEAITRPKGSVEISEVLKALVTAQSEMWKAPPVSKGLLTICEAQATVNEFVLHASRETRGLEEKRRTWYESSYWDIPKRFGWTTSATPKEFTRIAAAVLLATDIALDGIVSPSLHAAPTGRLILHPSQAVDALAVSYKAWRHVLDNPLETWRREDFLERREYAAKAAFGTNHPALFDIPPCRPEDGEDRHEHALIQYLGVFAALQQRITKVRSLDPVAALFPVSAIRERPETFMGTNDHLWNLTCPFISVGGSPYQNHIDEETWVRWRLLSGYEIWLDNMFGGWGEDFEHLPGDAHLLGAIRDIAKIRIESAHAM